MITGVEFDFVVPDSTQALALYEKIFEVTTIEATNLVQGQNEAIFMIYGTRFHILDENEAFQLIAPKPGVTQSSWFNVMVLDIQQTYAQAMQAGCKKIQAVTELPEMGIRNAIFIDPYGYLWMLHQLHHEK